MQQQQDLKNEGTLQKRKRRNSTFSNKFGCVSKKILEGCVVLGSERLVWT
jgi:hypothetical protein